MTSNSQSKPRRSQSVGLKLDESHSSALAAVNSYCIASDWYCQQSNQCRLMRADGRRVKLAILSKAFRARELACTSPASEYQRERREKKERKKENAQKVEFELKIESESKPAHSVNCVLFQQRIWSEVKLKEEKGGRQ